MRPAWSADVKHSSGDDDDDESEQSARVSIKFTNAAGDQSRTLSIKVKVEEDDGRHRSQAQHLARPHQGRRGQGALAPTPGPACSATPIWLRSATPLQPMARSRFGTITPAGATTSTDDGKATVTFATGEQVRIKVRDHDGQMTVSVKERIRCDSADPVTNVETSIADDHHDGDHHDDGDHKGGDHGRGGDDDNNNTSTSSTTVPDHRPGPECS